MDLLEREACLTELTECLGRALKGSGCLALVAGEAGIGKTSLLQTFATTQHGARVLWGACDALFTPRPLAPLHDIGRQTEGALQAALASGSSRDIVFAATLDELERQGSLVVFEDVHWADHATLDLLKFLGRRIHRTRSLLVVTYRDDEVGPKHPLHFVIGELPRASTRRISLAALSEAAVSQLARRAERPSKGLHQVTGGNPFFVTEVLASKSDPVPVTVRDAVLARAAKLSASARELAELVSVVPGRAEGWLLEQAARATPAAIDECCGIGMMRGSDDSLAFRHELARRALEDSLSPAKRQALHSKVLDVLAHRPEVSVSRVAHHADGARDADRVLRFAPIAAAQASAVGAHSAALSHYETALKYADVIDPEDRAPMLEKLSYECYLTGQHERAIEPRLAALKIWRTAGSRMREGDTLRWLSRLTWFAGRRAEARRQGLEAIKILESLPPSEELAMAYGNLAHLDMESHESDSAVEWAQKAIQLAEPWEHDGILIHALTVTGTARLIAGNALGWMDLERSLHLAISRGSQEEVARAYASSAAMAISRRQYAQAAHYQADGLAYCEKRDLDSWWLYMLAGRARMRFEQSDWQGASEDIDTVLRHQRATSVTRIPALEVLGHLRIRRGDPDAMAPLDEARALSGSEPDLQRIGRLAAAVAEAKWLVGDRDSIVREVMPAYRRALQQRDPRMRGELAAWLWRVGALEEAPNDIAEPYASEIAGDWRRAAQQWQELGCPYEHACLLAWHGSENEQREGLEVFTKLGANPAAQTIRRQMRTQGVRGIPRGSRPSTQSDPHGLTKREAQISALLSQGLRNAAIAKRLSLSPKTVEHHVSAILRKLGVQSRAEAIATFERAANGRSSPSRH
jgi:DNA-binding CsgD family transcriptional regulator/tetratricopeptide (TPR) repeat protein